jgi:hypothetical protein
LEWIIDMPDLEMLARIDENVKYLRATVDTNYSVLKDHMAKDEQISRDFLKPLWEAHQQDIGAEKNRGVLGAVGGYFINAGIAIAAAWAAVRGLK